MKVLVTPRSFGKENPELFTRLTACGLTLARNTTGATLTENSMMAMLADCEGLIVGIDPVNKKVLDAAPKLQAISKYGVGLDNIDLAECERRRIRVSRTVGANSNAVADYAFALMLGVARRVAMIDRHCRKRDWGKITSLDVYGKTVGIIGLGAIGKAVARRARGFEMRLLACDTVWDEEFCSQYEIAKADPDQICREADFISLHCNLTAQTANILDARRIGLLKPTAIIINTARGGLIDEAALLAALKANKIWGAGLDVFAVEPPENADWYDLENVIIGSHCSASTKGAVEMMGSMAVSNLLRDLELQKK